MPPAIKTQSAVSQTFGLLFGVIGLINMGWGNDFFYGLFILWSSLGVGELFDKIEQVKGSF